MRKHPIKKKTFQYVYAKCYSEIFVQVEKYSINLRNEFLITFKAWKCMLRSLKGRIIKKHKGLKKGALGMDFESYAKKTNALKDIKSFGQLEKEKQKQYRFSAKKELDGLGRS